MRRLALTWPSWLPNAAPSGRPLRLLAVSDETERSLELDVNRRALEPLDAVLGAGDLEPDYLSFLADAFRVPLLYVRGNHDRGGGWAERHHLLPRPLDGQWEKVGGITVRGMSWPSELDGQARRDDLAAWRQAVGLFRQARLRGPAPGIILSHVPPKGMGDTPTDPYHAGFAAYRWLCRNLRPTLWVHGHTTLAATTHWRETWQRTTLVNVTGAALIEITPGPR
ncbi:hypothetical protein BH24CHL7_BH24CHL7_04820 [soil metagenome]